VVVLGIVSFIFPLALIVTVPVLIIAIPVVFLLVLVSLLTPQPPFRCAHCGQVVGELTSKQKAATAQEQSIESIAMHELRAEQARALAAKMRRACVKSFELLQSASRGLGRFVETAVSQVNRLLLKMVGGEENIILYRFLQVIVVSIPFAVIAIPMAISSSNRHAEQARIEAANQGVRQAVEKAEKWIQVGQLANADQIEEGLNSAEADAVATQKTSVATTLAAFRNIKVERQAARILESALKFIAQKQFDKAQRFLRQYREHPYATEQQKARTLLSEITLATSDEDALRTLLAMDDKAFSALSNGSAMPAIPSITHPVLLETRIDTLKRNVAEAGRQREEQRKKAEAEQLAEKEAIQRSKQLAAKAIQKEKEAAERLEQLAAKAKQDEEDKKQHLAASCPLSIEGLPFDRDVIGTPQIKLRVRNRESQSIEAFKVVVACYNKFGDPINRGFGGNEKTLIYQQKIDARELIVTNGSWAFYGYDAATRFKVTVVQVKMGDGTEWSPPKGFEDVNSKSYEVTK